LGAVKGAKRRLWADFFNLQVPLVTCLGNELAAAQMGENRRRRQSKYNNIHTYIKNKTKNKYRKQKHIKVQNEKSPVPEMYMESRKTPSGSV